LDCATAFGARRTGSAITSLESRHFVTRSDFEAVVGRTNLRSRGTS
jgi:hypothetical protein